MRQDGRSVTGITPSGYTVHNVHILDASGSMQGAKYVNALAGINEEINSLKGDTSGVNFTNTIVEFDSGNGLHQIPLELQAKTSLGADRGMYQQCRQTTHYFMTPLAACSAITGRNTWGGTPLYQTVGEIIEKLLAAKQPDDKVVLKIFTDGDENSSTGKYARIPTNVYRRDEGPLQVTDCPALRTLIDAVQSNSNFTITFIGTERDTSHVVKHLGMFASNTLVHDNTARGIKMSYNKLSSATRGYSKAVASGASLEELKGNFFKRVADEPLQENIQISKPKTEKKEKTK